VSSSPSSDDGWFISFSSKTRKALVTFAVAAVAGITGLVFAAWLSETHSSAKGKLGRIQAVQISADVAATEDLYPGESAAGTMRLTNPNSRAVTLPRAGQLD
jgi:hypothetical protein